MLPRQNKWLTRSRLRDSTCCVSMVDVGWKAQVTRDRIYTYIKHSVTKVASELGMKGNEVSAVSFHSRHFSHLSPVWHFHSCSERRTEDTNVPFVHGALCPHYVPDRLREETKSDRDVNRSMWFTICIPWPQGLRWQYTGHDVQAFRRNCHMVPSTLLLKWFSPHKSLAATFPSFIFDIDLAVTSPPLGTVASLREMMKASEGRPPWLHTKQTPLWTLWLLLFSLQFNSGGGQRAAQLGVMCGSHVARAWVMLLLRSGHVERRTANIPRLK